MRKSFAILPLATSLAALTTNANGTVVSEPASPQHPAEAQSPQSASENTQRPNLVVDTGEAFLGLIVTKTAAGSVVAQHYSHESHASHESHSSHVSGY